MVMETQAKLDPSGFDKMFERPDVKEAFKAIANGTRRAPSFSPEYIRGQCLGLYNDTCGVDGSDALSWEARKKACIVAPSVVGLSYRSVSSDDSWKCSGVIVEYKGKKRILTSTYIFGDRSWNDPSLQVDVILPSRKKVTGTISSMDKHYNIALIEADIDNVRSASFAIEVEPVGLGDVVTAVGRHFSFKLIASVGKINVRGDHFESDDLLSSTCTISEWGIGGPLVDSLGRIVGMNFFSIKASTPFMPSYILLKCVEHLLKYGSMLCPWLGMKVRSLNELKLHELGLIKLRFLSINGLVVREVTKGSPVDLCGICVGDVIVACNGTLVSSPVKFADVLFKMVDSCASKVTSDELRLRVDSCADESRLEVVIQRFSSGTTIVETKNIDVQSFSPEVINCWPVLPK